MPDKSSYYACSTGRGAALWPVGVALLALRRRRRPLRASRPVGFLRDEPFLRPQLFPKNLTGMDRWLDKVAAFAEHKKVAPEVILNTRLAVEQNPLLQQIQSACDYA